MMTASITGTGITPGQWWTKPSAARFGDDRLDVAVVASVPLPNGGSKNVILAEAFGRVGTDCYLDAEANARLIAAAPELLAAAKAAVEMICGITTEQFAIGADRDTRIALIAVIAKAEGRAA